MPGDADLDAIAWQLLSDLCRPGGELATLPPEGLQRLIGMRLEREAQRSGVPPAALAEAFSRAMAELTGAGKPPRPAPGADDPPAEPPETIDDL